MRCILFSVTVILFCFSCKKTVVTPAEELPPLNGIPNSGASLRINIDHVVDGAPLALNTATYVTAGSDTFSVKLFKYYLTNISLSNDAGQTVTIPGSYYLVDEGLPASKTFTLQNVPVGEYQAISFLIGVDSAKNVSGAQAGVLDPVYGMFWDWNSGYIMAKMEGYSPQSGSNIKDLSFHIGGYNGPNRGVRVINLNFPMKAHVHAEHQSQVNMSGDLAKWFSGVNSVDFNTTYFIGNISAKSRGIAENYTHMFTVTSVVN